MDASNHEQTELLQNILSELKAINQSFGEGMDSSDNEQTQILRNIWNEIKAVGQSLGARIDQTNVCLDAVRTELSARIDETNNRIDAVRIDLGERIDQTNLRIDQTNVRLDKVEETLRELAGQQIMLGRAVKSIADRHDRSLEELRDRVTRLETLASQHR